MHRMQTCHAEWVKGVGVCGQEGLSRTPFLAQAVAEMTGRKGRVVRDGRGRAVYELRARSASAEVDSLNVREAGAGAGPRRCFCPRSTRGAHLLQVGRARFTGRTFTTSLRRQLPLAHTPPLQAENKQHAHVESPPQQCDMRVTGVHSIFSPTYSCMYAHVCVAPWRSQSSSAKKVFALHNPLLLNLI